MLMNLINTKNTNTTGNRRGTKCKQNKVRNVTKQSNARMCNGRRHVPLSLCPLPSTAAKNRCFLDFFNRFLGFLNSLDFNVHNAEHRYMTHDK